MTANFEVIGYAVFPRTLTAYAHDGATLHYAAGDVKRAAQITRGMPCRWKLDGVTLAAPAYMLGGGTIRTPIVLDGDLYARLLADYTTPLLPEWIDWLRPQLVNPLTCYNCDVAALHATQEILDTLVSGGLAGGSLTI